MSFPVRRPAKISRRVTRNFVSRDWTSIGLRGMRVTRPGTRTKAGPTRLSYRHTDESRIVGFDTPASNPPLATSAVSEKDWSELLWLGLILLAIAAVAAVQVIQ